MAWSGSYCRDADTIGAWYAAGGGDPDWAGRRARVVATLAEADRLAALAELVGAGALPGHERVVMLAGRLLREAVLHQSALSTNDAHCAPAKSAALVDVVFDVVGRCERLVDAGLPASVIEECDFSMLLRAREDTGASDADGVRHRGAAMLRQLEELA